MAELGVGYISIVPEVSKITPGISKALQGAEPAAEKTGQSMGGKLAGSLGGVLKKGALGAGVAAGGAISAGLVKGIGRLNSIEQAEAKLKGLGNSTQKVGNIMENALASVNGTAFGLEEAATSAAGLVAAGIKPGQELETTLKTVADTATIAGASMQDMGTIFGSVAARGKLQGDDMLQLLSRGVPVLQLLAEETGKTSAEISDMVSAGEIDFATFEKAMRRGMGGAALEAGKTAQGAFKNMWAAAGRLGATLAGPFFSQAAGAFTGVTKALDGMNKSAKPIMADFANWLTGTGVPALQRFGASAVDSFNRFRESAALQAVVGQTVDAFRELVGAGKALGPALGSIIGSLGEASAALGVGTWQLFVSALRLAGAAANVLAGPLNTVAGLMKDHPGLVTAAVAAWAGFKTIPGVVSKITDALSPTGSKLSEFSDAVRQSREEVSRYAQAHPEVGKLSIAMRQLGANVPAIASMTNAYRDGVNSLQPFITKHREAGVAAQTLAMETKSASVFADAAARQMGNSMQVGVARMVAPIKGAGMAGLSLMKSGLAGVKSAASGLMGAFGGPWGVALAGAGIVLSQQSNAAAGAKAAHERMTQAVHDAAAAQVDLQASLTGTTGELGEQGLAAAARIAKGEMAQFIEQGSRPLGIDEKINNSTVAVDQFLNKIPGVATETQKSSTASTTALRDMQSGYDALKRSADDMGIPMEKLNDIVAKGGPEYDRLIAKLRESGPQANYAADQLENARAKVDGLVQAARNADGGFTTAAAAIKTLADAGSSAEDKLTALETIMQALGLAPKNAEKAMMDAAKAVDGLADSAASSIDATAGLGGAMLTLDGKLDPANANARALSDALGTMRQSLEKVAINGGDTTAAFRNMSPELEKLQQQFGLTDEQMKKLVQSNGLLPDKIDMAVGLQGADKVTQDLASLQVAIEAAPDKKDINVGVLDDNSAQKIRDIGFEVERLPDGSSNVHVDDAEAKEKLLWLSQNGFPAIDIANPTAKVNLDDSGMMFKLEYAKMQLATLDLQRPTPLANMDIGMLSGAQIDALNKVGLLNGQRPTPAAGMNISQLSEKQQIALAQVFDLGNRKPTPVGNMNIDPLTGKKREASGQVDALGRQRANPVANLNNDGVRQGADDAKRWIGGIVGKTITVTFRAVYEGFKDKFGIGGGYTGGHFGGNGHFARYATGGRHGGYRLPKSGPGTEVTDGFLAFDRNNVPAARLDAGEWVINSRSSEKYSKELAQINRGTFPKLPGYAEGGRHLRHADEIANFAKGIEGKPYVWGGVNWGDCSGAMSAIARFAVGLAPFAGRFATGNMRQALAQMGFKSGRGGPGDLRMGWFNGGPYGGHTAGTLPNGVNVEMGGRRGNGQYGGPAAGSNDPSFTDHAYLRVPGGWKIGGVDGLEAFATPGSKTYGKAGDSYTGGAVTGGGYSADSTPSSWSDVAGIAASSWAKGQVQDILGVFGIPDTPPALAAYKQYMDMQKQGNGSGDQRTVTRVDDEKVEKLDRQIKEAKADLVIQEMRLKEQRASVGVNKKGKRVGPSEATLAASELSLRRKKQRILEMEKQLADEKRGHEYNVKKDGTLGGRVTEKVAPSLNELGGTTPTVNYNPKRGAEQWRPLVRTALGRHGLPLAGNENRTVQQIQIESGGNPRATNNWDSNAAKGTPSGGLLQVIKPTFDSMKRMYASAFRGVSGDQFTPLPNLLAGIGWARHKYGGPSKVWPTRAGYKDGGFVRGPGGPRGDKIPAWLSDAEFVVNAASTAKNLGLLGAINSGAPVQATLGTAMEAAKELSVAFNGGDWGFASTGRIIGDSAAKALVNRVGDAGVAVDEFRAAFAGGDWGYAATSSFVGDGMARWLIDAAATAGRAVGPDSDLAVSVRELSTAFEGGDWGYGSLSRFLGEGGARAAVNGVADIGEAIRGGQAAASESRKVVNNFMAANPEEMYRMYRRANARDLHGKVGAR